MEATKSIVQIFANNIEFDWANPHRVYNEYQSFGTGFFIDNKYILTCAHVIEDSIKTLINIPHEGKKKIQTELIAVNFDLDVALLKVIDYQAKSYLKLGSSSHIQQGDQVKVIGFPMGEDRLKFTSGIISGIQGKFLQTDAPINSGNSGGPLLNKNNLVIGINTQKMANADNIGYSTPIDSVIQILDEMKQKTNTNGEDKILTVPEIACSFMNIDKNLSMYVGLPQQFIDKEIGYMIRNLSSTSPLYIAGLRPYYIILSINGIDIDNYGEIRVGNKKEKMFILDYIESLKFGSTIKIKFWPNVKDKQIQEIDVPLNVKYPYGIRFLRPILEKPQYEILFGVIFMPLTLNHLKSIESLNISSTKSHKLLGYAHRTKREEPVVFISNILPGSYIGDTELLSVGNVIKKINGIEVKTINEFREALKKIKIINNQKYITIKTKNKNMVVMNIDEMYKQDLILSEIFNYKISNFYSLIGLASNQPIVKEQLNENLNGNVDENTQKFLQKITDSDSIKDLLQ